MFSEIAPILLTHPPPSNILFAIELQECLRFNCGLLDLTGPFLPNHLLTYSLPRMFQRFAIRMTLLCYSVIALFGQQLHEWIEHDDGDEHPAAVVAVFSPSSGPQIAADQPNGCEHDCDHCAICQHQSLGQIFVATPPLEILLGVRELLSLPAPEPVVCPAHFSPAQPRAPPNVVA
jgi:hypothetical protein